MATLPTITDVFRCAFKWSGTGQTLSATNVMHVKKGGATPADIAVILNANVTAAMWPFTSGNFAVKEIDITPLDGLGTTFPYVPGTPAKFVGGGGAGDYVPSMCALIKLVTAKRGRSYRGRVYTPFVVETLVASGVLTGASVSACTTAWVAFVAALSSAGAPLQVASYKHATSEPVVAAVCESFYASQRKRQKRTSN